MYGLRGERMMVSYWEAPAAVGKLYQGPGTGDKTPAEMCSWPTFIKGGMDKVISST